MIRITTLATAALAFIAWALPLTAQAALPYGSLAFVTPSASVTPDETIDVLMRLDLDADSPPLAFSSDPLSGFDPADLPTQGTWFDPVTGASELRDFASISGAFLNVYYVCSGTFTGDGCGPSASYRFDFWFGGESGPPSLVGVNSFSLAPGASTEFLLGRFTPLAGGAEPGTYRFYTAGVTLGFVGQDALGETLFSDGIDIARSCPDQTDDCAFVRTVSAVPEPGTLGLWLAGVAVAGFVARRRA
jgi:hypothetical protein